MNIEFAEIDSQVAIAVQSRLNVQSDETATFVPSRRSQRRTRRSRSIRTASALTLSLVLPPLLGFMLGGLISSGGPDTYPVAYFIWFFTWITGTALGLVSTMRYSKRQLPKSSLTLDDMLSIFPQLKLTRAEKVYSIGAQPLNSMTNIAHAKYRCHSLIFMSIPPRFVLPWK